MNQCAGGSEEGKEGVLIGGKDRELPVSRQPPGCEGEIHGGEDQVCGNGKIKKYIYMFFYRLVCLNER